MEMPRHKKLIGSTYEITHTIAGVSTKCVCILHSCSLLGNSGDIHYTFDRGPDMFNIYTVTDFSYKLLTPYKDNTHFYLNDIVRVKQTGEKVLITTITLSSWSVSQKQEKKIAYGCKATTGTWIFTSYFLASELQHLPSAILAKRSKQ